MEVVKIFECVRKFRNSDLPCAVIDAAISRFGMTVFHDYLFDNRKLFAAAAGDYCREVIASSVSDDGLIFRSYAIAFDGTWYVFTTVGFSVK